MLRKYLTIKHLVVLALFLIALYLVVSPPDMLTKDQTLTLGIVLVTLSLWATGIVPGFMASLLFFAVTLILKLSPPNVVLSGFTSTAIWLVFSGSIIAATVRGSGLGERLGAILGRHLTGHYAVLVSGLFIATAALSFIIPSSLGRFFVMLPIAMALASRAGFAKGSNGHTAIALTLILSANMTGFTILPSNVPNLVLAGASETIHGITLTYASYLALHFPVLGLLKGVITVFLVLHFFPDRVGAPLPEENQDVPASGPLSARQWYAIAILLATLLLWMTDSMHGINAAWVGLSASLLLMVPGIGAIRPENFDKTVSLSVLIFTAGILSLGAVINATGLGTAIAHGLENALPLTPGRDFLNFMSLALMAFLTGMVTTLPGVPAVLAPLAAELSHLTGFSVTAVLMTQVVGFSTVMLPYQAAPLMVGLQVTGQPVSRMIRITLPLSLITIAVLLPLDFLWWKLIGLI
ncbi:SLC13 family permease [Martelella sp. HB161492]|uniref:SLC13 family permease n=1 Tax=Martelella sp. HB161492 TaxID=2720726 RepID=UPI0015919B58|nr:SLC13 family permease [Martelella sp. HB161492]